MSHPVPATLYRVAAVAGCGSAAILLINAAKRAEIIPTTAATQLVAPLAQMMALALITAALPRIRPAHRQLRPGRVPAERVLAVCPGRSGVRDQPRLPTTSPRRRSTEPLRAGPLGRRPDGGVACRSSSARWASSRRCCGAAKSRPGCRWSCTRSARSPVALRAFVPEAALDLGLVLLAASITWLAIWLYGRSDQIDTWATSTTDPPVGRHSGVDRLGRVVGDDLADPDVWSSTDGTRSGRRADVG